MHPCRTLLPHSCFLTTHACPSRQERAKLEKEPLDYIAEIESEDIFKWKVTILGPPQSPYAGGKFVIKMDFPEQYPFKPPIVSVVDGG